MSAVPAPYKVLVTDHMEEASLEVLSSYPAIEVVSEGTLGKKELLARIPDFDAVIVRSPTKITAEVISAAAKLMFIGRAGVGVDNIDLKAATARGIVVLHVPGENTVSTAEHTVGMILAVARRIAEGDRSVRQGRWARNELDGVELFGKLLGVVGFGRVGREVARRMLAFSMRVIASDPYVAPEVGLRSGVEIVSLESLLRASDIVTLHVALTPETRGLISEREIVLMKDGALLVNCARGGVADEDSVLRALDSGKIAGVAFDVFEHEPPGAHPLLGHPRSVFTPHLGAATREARVRVAVHIADSIAKALTTGEIRDAVSENSL
jgi:D-3-phosphoglycerate dehydrogenase